MGKAASATWPPETFPTALPARFFVVAANSCSGACIPSARERFV
jgi:hypothetical protein